MGFWTRVRGRIGRMGIGGLVEIDGGRGGGIEVKSFVGEFTAWVWEGLREVAVDVDASKVESARCGFCFKGLVAASARREGWMRRGWYGDDDA